jgi:hypothetical protein
MVVLSPSLTGVTLGWVLLAGDPTASVAEAHELASLGRDHQMVVKYKSTNQLLHTLMIVPGREKPKEFRQPRSPN